MCMTEEHMPQPRTDIKRKQLSCLLMAGMICVCTPLSAIEVTGLDDLPDLKAYIEERVITPLENEEKQIYPAAVKGQIQKALKANGYYSGRIIHTSADVPSDNEEDEEANKDDIYNVMPGGRYVISSYKVLGYDDPPQIKLKSGNPLVAQDVIKAQRNLLNTISDKNCFYELAVKHRIYLDPQAQLADLEFDVDASDNALFGTTAFIGAENIKRSYLENFITYEPDTCWKSIELENTKEALLKTGLISTIDVELPDDVPADKTIPIIMELQERAPRKVRLGANFNTSEGPGISAEWLHRNYFGAGEQLSVSTRLSSVLQRLGMDFKKPFFLSDKQNLNFSSELRREDTDAYEEFGLNVSADIDREISRYWTGSLGVGLDLLQVREEGEQTENFALVSAPARMNYDSRNNVLNPTDGHTLRLAATPYMDTFGNTSPFLKTRVTGTTYIGLGEHMLDSIIALRASVGSIWGTETQDIPASVRFYAGGGGSIRGFGYQEAGAVDEDDDPEGGRSLVETSTELRLKFSEKIGGVAFVDAGGVYDSAFPDLEGGAYIGAGVGARYYTDFGPIRFDIAVPVNKTENLDQGYQFYISIGQAF